MVSKYIILAKSNDKTFDIPRQLVDINGERLIERTIRLLKENGVKDIIITSDDERFDGLGAERYDGKYNNFDYIERTGYWLDAFPFELMNEPVCFIWGDVYFSDNAIKTIVETDTDSTLFFCSYNNNSKYYIKHHDEPLAYKIVDCELFKEHINRVKKLYDEGKTIRHPIVWEVYRSINGIDVNEHKMTNNFVAINDISCDIDSSKDLNDIKEKIKEMEVNKMIKVEANQQFTLDSFEKIKSSLVRASARNKDGELYKGDTFICDKEMADYLTGKNDRGYVVVDIIEVIPEKKEEVKEQKVETKPKKKKTSKK